MPRKKNVYNKERYEQNKEEILKYRRERYRIIFIFYIYIVIIRVGGMPPKVPIEGQK